MSKSKGPKFFFIDQNTDIKAFLPIDLSKINFLNIIQSDPCQTKFRQKIKKQMLKQVDFELGAYNMFKTLVKFYLKFISHIYVQLYIMINMLMISQLIFTFDSTYIFLIQTSDMVRERTVGSTYFKTNTIESLSSIETDLNTNITRNTSISFHCHVNCVVKNEANFEKMGIKDCEIFLFMRKAKASYENLFSIDKSFKKGKVHL